MRFKKTQRCYNITAKFGPWREKNQSSEFQTKWDSNQPAQLQRLPKNCNFARGKSRYESFQEANNKGADQTARMRILVCAFVVRKPRRQVFSPRSSNSLCHISSMARRLREIAGNPGLIFEFLTFALKNGYREKQHARTSARTHTRIYRCLNLWIFVNLSDA